MIITVGDLLDELARHDRNDTVAIRVARVRYKTGSKDLAIERINKGLGDSTFGVLIIPEEYWR